MADQRTVEEIAHGMVDTLNGQREEWEACEAAGVDEWYHWTDDVLSVDKREVMEINLTCGGPNVWLEVELVNGSHGRGVRTVTMCAAWGFENTRIRLSDESSAAWELAEYYAEQYDML